MKKKLKDRKVFKVIGQLLDGFIDTVPLGTTIKNVVTGGVKKGVVQMFDRNNDGKTTFADFKPVEIIGGLLGLVVLSVLVTKGVIDIQVLKYIAEIFGFTE